VIPDVAVGPYSDHLAIDVVGKRLYATPQAAKAVAALDLKDGRVLKMIGDEVMFLVEDPVAAAEIALGLADASRDAAELSDVRVGLALGPVLEREGDAYGPTVNLASRTPSTTRARPSESNAAVIGISSCGV